MKILIPKDGAVLSSEQLLRDALRAGIGHEWRMFLVKTEEVNGFIEVLLGEIKQRFYTDELFELK